MRSLNGKSLIFLIISLTNPINVFSRISMFQNHRDEFTNLVFQPRINSPKLPPDTSGIELIQKNGYPLEFHDVITEDGYILNIFRIPCGRNSLCNNGTDGKDKPPVFLLPPIPYTADNWVFNEHVDGCLAFVLADAGYDVWMGNLRGTHYSNKHLFLSNTDEAYWNFSFDEYGKYDVPAMMKYILEKTGKPKLHFIALSLGAIPFYSAMARYPKLNDQIALHISYGPFIFTEKVGLLPKLYTVTIVDFMQLVEATGGRTINRDGLQYLLAKIGSSVCQSMNVMGLCRYLTFSVFGQSYMSRDQVAYIYGRGYSFPSVKGIVHFLQIVSTGEFREFDYGPVRNVVEYGQSHPPEYNLNMVTAPVAFIQAPYDHVATNHSTTKLALSIRNVVDYHVIPDNAFSHIDYCCGERSNELVYQHTLKLLNQYS